MAYNLIDAAQARWRAHTWSPWSAPGALFHKGKLLERPADITPTDSAEPDGAEVA